MLARAKAKAEAAEAAARAKAVRGKTPFTKSLSILSPPRARLTFPPHPRARTQAEMDAQHGLSDKAAAAQAKANAKAAELDEKHGVTAKSKELQAAADAKAAELDVRTTIPLPAPATVTFRLSFFSLSLRVLCMRGC
jgi:hypothetical protein